MLPIETFLWGFLGSSAVELVTLLGFYQTRRARLPRRYRKAGFWITRVALAVLAGILAVGYDIHVRILAFNVGAATPLIVSLLAKGLRSGPPSVHPVESDPLASVSPSPQRAEASASERR